MALLQTPLLIPNSSLNLSSVRFFTGSDKITFPVKISPSPIKISFSPAPIRMGGGPRTFPGGVSKWQWKRMQAKKEKQLLKARLCRERQIYEMRKRAELKAAVSELERPWEVVERAPVLFSVKADGQLKALADRFQRPGGFDLWSERDGPQLFQTVDGLPSARFFPKGVVHSIKPYGKISDSPGKFSDPDDSSAGTESLVSVEEGEFGGSVSRLSGGSVYQGSRSRSSRFRNRRGERRLNGESGDFGRENGTGVLNSRKNNHNSGGFRFVNSRDERGEQVEALDYFEETEIDDLVVRQMGRFSNGSYAMRSGASQGRTMRSGVSCHREDTGIKGRRDLRDQQDRRVISTRNFQRPKAKNSYGSSTNPGNRQKYGSYDSSKRGHVKDHQIYTRDNMLGDRNKLDSEWQFSPRN